jgi:hypothetical protein
MSCAVYHLNASNLQVNITTDSMGVVVNVHAHGLPVERTQLGGWLLKSTHMKQ